MDAAQTGDPTAVDGGVGGWGRGRMRTAVGAGAAVVVALLAGVSAGEVLGWETGQRILAGATGVGPGAGEDGEIPTGTKLSPFDTAAPAVHNLDGPLLDALRRAAGDARGQGIDMTVTSGWRSRSYQQRLLDRGVVTYGSAEQARRFVSTPDRSAHVTGKAVDVGPTDAAYWLARHGARYGLCQVYTNEIWHFELLTAPGGTCPAQLPDAAG